MIIGDKFYFIDDFTDITGYVIIYNGFTENYNLYATTSGESLLLDSDMSREYLEETVLPNYVELYSKKTVHAYNLRGEKKFSTDELMENLKNGR